MAYLLHHPTLQVREQRRRDLDCVLGYAVGLPRSPGCRCNAGLKQRAQLPWGYTAGCSGNCAHQRQPKYAHHSARRQICNELRRKKCACWPVVFVRPLSASLPLCCSLSPPLAKSKKSSCPQYRAMYTASLPRSELDLVSQRAALNFQHGECPGDTAWQRVLNGLLRACIYVCSSVSSTMPYYTITHRCLTQQLRWTKPALSTGPS